MKKTTIIIYIICLSHIIIGQNINNLINLTNTKLKSQDYKGAINDCNKYISSDTTNETAYILRGEFYFNLGKNIKALADVNKALEINNKLEKGLLLKSSINSKLMRLHESMSALNSLIDINPNNSLAYLKRAQAKEFFNVHKKTYTEEDIMKDYVQGLRLDSKNTEILSGIANLKFSMGDNNSALEYFNKSLAVNSNQPFTYYNRSFVKKAMKDSIGSLADINSAIKLNPKEAEFYYRRSFLYQQNGDKIQSDNDFATFEKISKQNRVELNYKNGIDNFDDGNYNEAIKNFNSALSDYNSSLNIESSFGMVYYYRGLTYLELHNNKNACEDLKIANDAGVELAGIKLTENCK